MIVIFRSLNLRLQLFVKSNKLLSSPDSLLNSKLISFNAVEN